MLTRSIAFINILLYFPISLYLELDLTGWLGVSNLKLTWTKQLCGRQAKWKCHNNFLQTTFKKSKSDSCQMVSVWGCFCVKVSIYTDGKKGFRLLLVWISGLQNVVWAALPGNLLGMQFSGLIQTYPIRNSGIGAPGICVWQVLSVTMKLTTVAHWHK